MIVGLPVTATRFMVFEGSGPWRILEVDHIWNKPVALRCCHKSLKEEWIGDTNEKVFRYFFILGKELGLHSDVGLAGSSIRNRRQHVLQARDKLTTQLGTFGQDNDRFAEEELLKADVEFC